MTPPAATLTIVGDVHRSWRPADALHLRRSNPDLTLFVGDLGDEDVLMVREIAELPVPKVVLLGNHDAWQSCSQRKVTPALRQSLAILGDDHLAYAVREVPGAGISVLGVRPFSWGGPSLRAAEIYQEIYGFHTMRQSAVRIVEAARKAQHRDLVILAHNGPLGLSREPEDIYGKDFGKPGGDWGDRDLAIALPRIAELGLRVRAIVAGHMHSRLVNPRGGERQRFVRMGEILVVNPACVPRVRSSPQGEELSYFLRMRWRAGECLAVEELWVGEDGEVRSVQQPRFDQAAAVHVADEEEGPRR